MDSVEFKTRTVVEPCRLEYLVGGVPLRLEYLVGGVPLRLEYQLIHGVMLLYIVLGAAGTRLSLGGTYWLFSFMLG